MPQKSRRRALPHIPKARHRDVTRSEFNRVIDSLHERGDIITSNIGELRHDLDIQFKRIAQLQAELDQLKRRQ
jgi:hypothetical protein